jgi:DNA polymerase epsilon subunit 2
VLWDYASALQLYPLPSALVVCDAEANAFVEKYEGCCVMNPGKVTGGGKRSTASWVEYNIKEKMGTVREVGY